MEALPFFTMGKTGYFKNQRMNWLMFLSLVRPKIMVGRMNRYLIPRRSNSWRQYCSSSRRCSLG